MDLRRLLNTAYAALTEHMPAEDREAFDRSLVGDVLPEVDHRGRKILRRPVQSTVDHAREAMQRGGG